MEYPKLRHKSYKIIELCTSTTLMFHFSHPFHPSVFSLFLCQSLLDTFQNLSKPYHVHTEQHNWYEQYKDITKDMHFLNLQTRNEKHNEASFSNCSGDRLLTSNLKPKVN